MVTVTLRGVTADAFDEVNAELDAVREPPVGLYVHFVHAIGEDCVRIVDVWESEAAHDAYDEPRNPPAVLAKVLARRGLSPPELVSREVFSIQALITGHGASVAATEALAGDCEIS
jgi:hypothetical protein